MTGRAEGALCEKPQTWLLLAFKVERVSGRKRMEELFYGDSYKKKDKNLLWLVLE